MPKHAHPDVLDNGIALIRSNANQMHLVRTYAAGDSYATVIGNSLATVAMIPADYTLGNGSASARTLTTPSNKSANAAQASGASPNLHFAFVDTTTSRVLWATDETTDQVIGLGNPITFPSLVYTSNQPV
jgi:hypothetical protein